MGDNVLLGLTFHYNPSINVLLACSNESYFEANSTGALRVGEWTHIGVTLRATKLMEHEMEQFRRRSWTEYSWLYVYFEIFELF